jgi:hypothetical protein
MKVANIVRIAFGLILVAGAVANAVMFLSQPRIYDAFAEGAIISLYRDLWRSLVLPHLGLWLALVIAFEISAGILILSKGIWVRVGLLAGILFCLGLVPFWWYGGALLNVAMAVALAWLLRYDFAASVVDAARRRVPSLSP